MDGNSNQKRQKLEDLLAQEKAAEEEVALAAEKLRCIRASRQKAEEDHMASASGEVRRYWGHMRGC